METYVRQLIESHRTPEVVLAWQGGEPTLMGLDFFKRVMSVAQEAAGSKKINHTIQTNGTKLDDEWCQFFHEHDFLVGLSLDGPQEMHDAFRVDKGGDGTFDQVFAAARLLQKHEVEFNILSTVHAANADHPLDVYRFFRDEVGTQFMQFIPIIERATPELLPIANVGWGDYGPDLLEKVAAESVEQTPAGESRIELSIAKSSKRPLYTTTGSLVTERSVTAEQWGTFLSTIFDEWVTRDVGRVFVQLFDSALGSWLGQGASICIHRETCGDALALEHNGDLYSCDHFVEPDYFLGNIKEEHMITLVASDQQRKFGNDKRDTLPDYCLQCPVRFACNGGCPRNRFIKTPDGQEGLNYLCAGYKHFFSHVDRPMRIMAELLRQGRYADEVMTILNSEGSEKQKVVEKVGRNDPCPCGSGKKYKQCHGRARAVR